MSLKKINQLFNFEKGILQSSKCIEGEYDFITAASDWKKHNEYSHDCEALIFAAAASGSLGRTHYVNGKFISSDLCFILTPKDPEKQPVDLKFYHIIFNLYKTEIVAATKAGTSKEAIGLKVFGEYELPYFNTSIQRKVKEEFGKAELLKDSLFDEYSYQLTQLENLNQAILQEAVQGKLVDQNPDDEPASELLKRIKAEKALPGKKQKPLPPIKPEEIPFEIPENWMWCRLDEVCAEIIDCPHSTPKYLQEDTRFYAIDTTCIEVDGSISRLRNLSENGFIERIKRLEPAPMDIVFAREGSIGLSAFIPENFKICLGQRVMLFRCANGVLPEYLKYVITDKKYLQRLLDKHRGIGAKHVNVKDIKLSLIPVPALSEQKRIVAEIEKQFAKTKQLKEHIIANQQATEQLLKALLHQAFEVKEEEVKTNVQQVKGKVVELDTNTVNWDNLVAEPFEKYAAHAVNNIQDIDWEMAMMVACMKNKLGVTYGDVGLQKNVYNTNNLQPVFSKQYAFANSNFGTYCHELKEDLKRNPYLIAQKVANSKEVYAVNPKYSKQVLDKLSAPENKEFIQAINRMLSIYEHPFINKETDKIELYNTVLKVALDKNTRDINNIYQGMKDWKINQTKYKTKAEKFSKPDAERMLKLLVEKKIL